MRSHAPSNARPARQLAAVLAAVVLVGVPVGALAEDQLTEARQELRDTKDRIRARAARMRQLQRDMSRLATRIAQTESDIGRAMEHMDKLSARIGVLQERHARLQELLVAFTVSPTVEVQHVTGQVTEFNAAGHDLPDTQHARAEYLQAGYDAIPLKPLTKDPARKGWPTKATITQWHNAPADSNIGLRAGHGKAFIDCHDKNQAGTFANVTRWLEGLGHTTDTLPIVRTPTGGAHVYVNFTGGLFGSKRNLLHDIGAGELRYDYGEYVAAPPSVIYGGAYSLVNGSIEHLPALNLHDVAQLADINGDIKPQAAPKMSRLALALSLGNEDILRDRYNNDRSSGRSCLSPIPHKFGV